MNNQQRAENAIKCIDTLMKTRAKQGKGEMGNRKVGRCCLAISCDALGIDYKSNDLHSSELQEAIGLIFAEGQQKIRGCIRHGSGLTALNDSTGYSFKEIGVEMIHSAHTRFRPGVAKLIRKHYSSIG